MIVSRICTALSVTVARGSSFSRMERVILAAALGQSIADADTILGFLERHHNRRVYHDPGSGAVAESRRCRETGDTSVLWRQYKPKNLFKQLG